jgi:hypothetical protein
VTEDPADGSSDRGIRQRIGRVAEERMMAAGRARFEAGFLAGRASVLSDEPALLREAAEVVAKDDHRLFDVITALLPPSTPPATSGARASSSCPREVEDHAVR